MIQVIERAGAILRALEPHPKGRSVGEIANEVGLPRSSVHRILKSLEAEHLVIAVSEERGFRLGPALMRLASSASAWLAEIIHPSLVELSAELDETVDLAIRAGATASFIDQVAAGHRLQAVSAVGLSFPLHCTANGKALLAELDDVDVATLIGDAMLAMTPMTITALGPLLDELALVRQTGLAHDREEHHLGISALGTMIENPYGLPVALSVPVPTTRFREREDELGRLLLAGRDRIERALARS